MLNLVLQTLGVCGAAVLLIAPGLLIVLCLPKDTLLPRMILPAAFILSPGVVALELAIASLAGVPFALFAPAAAAANFIGAVALFRYTRPSVAFDMPLAWLVAASLIFIPFVMIVMEVPLRREYGWHNMMQLAVMHSIYGLPNRPEDLGLAGTALNYGWLGWASLATMAKLVGKAPTLLFLPVNFFHFVALVLVLCEATAALLKTTQPMRDRMIAIGVGAILLAPGVPDMAIAFIKTNYWPWFGEVRITPLLTKYVNMDLMVLGLSAMALMIYAMIRAAQSHRLGSAILMPIAASAACLVYPLFLPSCILLAATYLLVTLLAARFPQWGVASYTRAEIGVMVAAWALCVALTVAYLGFLGQDASGSPVALHALENALLRIKKLAWIFLVIDGLLVFALYKAWQARSGSMMLLIAASVAFQVAFMLLSMATGTEYKFLYVSLLLSIPAITATTVIWAAESPLRRYAMAGAFAALLAVCLAATTGWQQPPTLALADALDEGNVEIGVVKKDGDTSWMRVVRDGTPSDAVLLSGATDKPVAVFALRALYVCADNPQRTATGDLKLERLGYSMTCAMELQDVKRYDAQKITQRMAVLKSALAPQLSPTEASTVMEALRQLDRPIVLHTTGRSGFQAWLEEHHIGHAIFNTASDTVWLIDRADLERQSAQAP
jgi:hypothetical protein